jgi:N-acetylglucosaminyl-diphospho-decaprenol L-rhamnosyltransferase
LVSVPDAEVELSVLVVTYRNPEVIRACLASIYEQTRGCTLEVIVVDNDSGDATADIVEREFPQVRLVRSERNRGFAAATNLAASIARGEHLVLLNPDTMIIDRALDRLLAFARSQPEPGLYGGRTVGPEGALDPRSCWGAPTLWSTFCFGSGLSTLLARSAVFDPESLGPWERDTVRDVGVVTGCLLLTSRETWDSLGGFDERFFMYGEDVDLSLRARQGGLRVCICPQATVIHLVGTSTATSATKMEMVMRGKAAIIRKHWRQPQRALGLALLRLGVLQRAMLGRGRSHPTFWSALWRSRRSWIVGYPPPAAGR